MKTFILFGSLILFGLQLTAQKLVNYDKNGDKLKNVAEYVDLRIQNASEPNGRFVVPTVLASVLLGPVYNIVTSTMKSSLEKRQKSFTATYSNSGEFSGESFKKAGLKSLIVSRYAINSLEGLTHDQKMAEYELALAEEDNSLSIEVKSVWLNRSKARYKKEDNLAIAIKIKATSTTVTSKTESVTGEKKPKSESFESEGTIAIPVIKVTGGKQDLRGKGDLINKLRLNGIGLSTSTYVKFSVTITETNISRIDPSVVQTIFVNNNGDLQSILKTIFGVAQK